MSSRWTSLLKSAKTRPQRAGTRKILAGHEHQEELDKDVADNREKLSNAFKGNVTRVSANIVRAVGKRLPNGNRTGHGTRSAAAV